MARAFTFGLVAVSVFIAMPDSPMAEEPVWTNEVKRIDRETQTYERLPDKQVTFATPSVARDLRIRGFVRVHDSVSFTHDKQRYQLAGVAPIAKNAICTRADGSRWACGLAARTFLQSRVLALGSSCRRLSDVNGTTLLACTSDGRDLARTLAERGFAIRLRPTGP